MVDPYPFLFGAVFLFTVIQAVFVFAGWYRRNIADEPPVSGTGNVDADEFIQTETTNDKR